METSEDIVCRVNYGRILNIVSRNEIMAVLYAMSNRQAKFH